MISDEYIKQLFANGNKLLHDHPDSEATLPTQFFRGINPFKVDCMRHMEVFGRFKVIPEACFDCYKVTINLKTVVDLFKLMVLFEGIKLPDDNARKCMAECREQVSGSYKGFIYCSTIEQGEAIKKWILQIITEEISNDVTVSLKRGCSEYSRTYPEYAQIKPGVPAMKYDESWRQYENIVDKDFNFEPQPETFNQPSFTFNDARVMLGWLKYAVTIGDSSYLKISNRELTPWTNLNRPRLFPFK